MDTPSVPHALASWMCRLTATGIQPAPWPDPARPLPGGTLWLHLDRTDPGAARWLYEESGISHLLVDQLLEQDPRPRYVRDGDGLLLLLRTANLNPGADPEDLVSVRIWAEPGRIVVLRNRACPAIDHLQARFQAGPPLSDTSAVLAMLIEALVDALDPILDDIDEGMDILEEQLVLKADAGHVTRLASHRRQVLHLHRFMAPQRDLLARLEADPPPWISAAAARTLAGSARIASRDLEDLQAARDHGTLLQEELSARLSEHLNRRLYLFTVVAAIFIPLTFFTGLLGANVAGIPAAEERWAFAAICILSIAISVGQYWFFRWRRLI